MTIQLQDRSILISYIQIYLRDYFGMTLVKSKFSNSYEISQNQPIRVTGQYTRQMYLAVSLFMTYNYPNEQFPERWDLRNPSDDSWVVTPFDSETLKLTMNMLMSKEIGSMSEFTESDYEQLLTEVEDPQQYFSWNTLIKYFYNEDDLLEQLDIKSEEGSTEYTQSDTIHSLVVFLTNNLEWLDEQPKIASLNSRILSYFLEEVVTSGSSPDEILRIQKIIYPGGIEVDRAGVFDEQMTQDVTSAQQNFIQSYTVMSQGTLSTSLPEGYEGFKVTGYVDPWTELLLKGGID